MRRWWIALCLFAALDAATGAIAEEARAPHPVRNPLSPRMLVGDWVPDDPRQIDFKSLPAVASQHAVVSDVRQRGGTRVHQHNYLIHFGNQLWAMWSDGPGVPHPGVTAERHVNVVPRHDQAGQQVSFATSDDGLAWSKKQDLAGVPELGYGWIARGFWVREGKLLALVSRYKAPSYRGPGLQLHAFEMESSGDGQVVWKPLGVAFDDTLNNFPPKQLPGGEWLMSRRDHRQNLHFMRGGIRAFDDWESFPMFYRGNELAAEEPFWWILPDNNLLALFRDNNRSGYLFRAFSTDNGQTWTKPVRTDFPDATSKFSGLRLKDGRYVLVSNANPKQRDPLTLAVSEDGLTFDRLGYLVGGRHIDYPHVIEHDGYVYVAFAGAKQTVEVLKIDLNELDKIDNRVPRQAAEK